MARITLATLVVAVVAVLLLSMTTTTLTMVDASASILRRPHHHPVVAPPASVPPASSPAVHRDAATEAAFQARLAELKAAVGDAPLKGWNSYDSFTWIVDEPSYVANTQIISEVLLPYGFTIATIDYYWYLAINGSQLYIDDYGRPQPDPTRFPSSAGGKGYQPLASATHDLGLLFGIHVMRGISQTAIAANTPVWNDTNGCTAVQAADQTRRCGWGISEPGPFYFYAVNTSSPCGQSFLNSLTAQYAAWGVDFLKLDCVYAGDFVPDQITAYSAAIENSGRPMLFSLSPGGDDLKQAAVVSPLANMYRVTGDTWDNWGNIAQHFDAAETMVPYVGVRGRYDMPSYPDLDMLPLGWLASPGDNQPPTHWSRLTLDEQQTLLSLWMIARSPLMMGGDLTHNEPNVMSKLTNAEALLVHNSSTNSMPLANSTALPLPKNVRMWRSESTAGGGSGGSATFHLAVFNLDDSNLITFEFSVAAAAPPNSGYTVCDVRDVWLRTSVGTQLTSVVLRVDTHASFLLTLTNCS